MTFGKFFEVRATKQAKRFDLVIIYHKGKQILSLSEKRTHNDIGLAFEIMCEVATLLADKKVGLL